MAFHGYHCVKSVVEVSVLLLYLSHVALTLEQPIIYNITEDQPARSYVGNLKIDAGLDRKYIKSVLDTLRFVFLGLGSVSNQYVTVGEFSGMLETSLILDRDVICPNKAECEITLDVAVQPTQYFEVIKLTLFILDRNDHAPMFDPSKVKYFFFLGLAEPR